MLTRRSPDDFGTLAPDLNCKVVLAPLPDNVHSILFAEAVRYDEATNQMSVRQEVGATSAASQAVVVYKGRGANDVVVESAPAKLLQTESVWVALLGVA